MPSSNIGIFQACPLTVTVLFIFILAPNSCPLSALCCVVTLKVLDWQGEKWMWCVLTYFFNTIPHFCPSKHHSHVGESNPAETCVTLHMSSLFLLCSLPVSEDINIPKLGQIRSWAWRIVYPNFIQAHHIKENSIRIQKKVFCSFAWLVFIHIDMF